MKRRAATLLLALLAGSCVRGEERSEIYLQRFFGECRLAAGAETDIGRAQGECEIITAMINAYNEDNPDARVSSNVVAWPGYPQLNAQLAAGDPPDLVTMHEGVLADYANRGLLEPVEPYLREAGIDPAGFTDASRQSVTVGDHMYGLPWDTHGGLFHVNTALFAEAGLMRDGRPVLPTSAAEFLAQARQFKARTGRPYLIQSLVGDPAYAARNLYTYLMAQGVTVFPDAKHIRLTTPQAHEILAFWRQITAEGLATSNMDTPAAIAAFRTGQGGIYPTGTWEIGNFEKLADTPGEPLYRNYAVYPYPRLWGRDAVFVSGHAWVVPRRERTPAQRAGIARFFRFMAAHNFDWARTGHLPAFRSVIDSPQFRALPHRADIAPLASEGHPLPGTVLRQQAIEGIVGEEAAAAMTGQKGIDQALADAERRVNELLDQMS